MEKVGDEASVDGAFREEDGGAARTQKWKQRQAATVDVEEAGDDGEVRGVVPGQPPLLAFSMELAGAMAAPSPPLARCGGGQRGRKLGAARGKGRRRGRKMGTGASGASGPAGERWRDRNGKMKRRRGILQREGPTAEGVGEENDQGGRWKP